MRAGSVVVCVLLLCAASARAESFTVDAGPACIYSDPEITPPPGRIPANWPSFTFGLAGTVDPRTARMTRVSDGHVVPLAFSSFAEQSSFAPTEPLVVGESYLVEHPICPDMPVRTALYDIVDPIPAPTTAGSVVVRGPFAANFGVWRGTCHRTYFFDVAFTPDPAFTDAQWSSFVPRVMVDGRSDGGTFTCPGGMPGALREGRHSIWVSESPWRDGSAPSPPRIDSTPVLVEARCADAVRVDAVTLVPLTPTEEAYWDQDVDGTCGTVDAALEDGGSDIDATLRDAGRGIDGGRIDAHTEPDTRSNCACIASGRGRSAPTAWIGLVALVGGSRVRRRNDRSVPGGQRQKVMRRVPGPTETVGPDDGTSTT